MSTVHQSVLLEESLAALEVRPDGCYLDATFGGGGHARAILARLGPEGRLFATDRDPQAVERGIALAQDPRCVVHQASFAELGNFGQRHGLTGRLQGLLLDLGVSSFQLEAPERGFSFMREGPLDMRMDPATRPDAATWLAAASAADISRVLRNYGEQPGAHRIASAIVRHRRHAPLQTTTELAQLVREVVPASGSRHAATRVFQALRIHINHELEELRAALQHGLELLARGGRLVVISFHSLEDRIVKEFIRVAMGRQAPPRGLPVRETERPAPQLRTWGRAQVPGEAEREANPRSRSAVLRVAERL